MEPKILLALDGSKNSMRAVAYVGDMIHGCECFHITLFHVNAIPPELIEHGGPTKPDTGRRLAEELQAKQRKWRAEFRETVGNEIFNPAKKILKDKGVHETLSTIKTKIVIRPHPDVARILIAETKAGRYSTLVLGKRGRSMAKDFLLGGVTCKVIHNIKDCTIWVVE